jgi:lipoate-protein ligase A
MLEAGGRRPEAPRTAKESPAEAWWLWRSGAGEAALNMAVDEALLEAAPALGRPLLRLYGWQTPAATFGYSQRYADAGALTPLRPLIRRPTGGGVVPHAGDWTYTLVFPPGHAWYALRARASYERLHVWLKASLDALGLRAELAALPAAGAPTHCFARAEQFDVLLRGAKIAGAAQRRTRQGLLIQGSVQPPANADRAAWEEAWCDLAGTTWGVRWQEWKPSPTLLARAATLAGAKYARDGHNRRR